MPCNTMVAQQGPGKFDKRKLPVPSRNQAPVRFDKRKPPKNRRSSGPGKPGPIRY